jgi:hypothetical protein
MKNKVAPILRVAEDWVIQYTKSIFDFSTEFVGQRVSPAKVKQM